MERRLTAILAADVAGYSRLMGANEVATLAALKAHRAELIDAKIAEHLGRIVKLTGDGMLVEFPSVVKAVDCAARIQREMRARNASVPEDRRIEFRIGVNLGDVIVEDGDIFGDGVNIAARIESIARPGGVSVSASVRDHVGNKLDLAFEDMGEQALKNIEAPVRVYNVLLDAAPAKPATMAPGPAGAPIPEQRSIAVLPFVNMSGDAEQEFFTDGLTEDIITDISNVPGFFVIARNSTFAYKGKPSDVRQIARDLGVNYILEGSARRSADRLRINVQLIDAAGGGNHIWAERYDRALADMFDVQDEVTRRTVEAITGKLNAYPVAERYRPTSIEAYDLCVRSRHRWTLSKAACNEARSYLERAIALDPNYCEAHWQLSYVLAFDWLHWGEPYEPNHRKSRALAQRAVDIDPNDSNAHEALATIFLTERRWDEAQVLYDETLRLNPNNADALANAADFYVMTGRPQQALEAAIKALRLNPHPPGLYYWNLGVAYIANGQYEIAATTLRREETYRTASRHNLAAALALLGRTTEAKEEARLFLATSPHWRISTWVADAPFKNPKDAQLFVDAYRLAGLPE